MIMISIGCSELLFALSAFQMIYLHALLFRLTHFLQFSAFDIFIVLHIIKIINYSPNLMSLVGYVQLKIIFLILVVQTIFHQFLQKFEMQGQFKRQNKRLKIFQKSQQQQQSKQASSHIHCNSNQQICVNRSISVPAKSNPSRTSRIRSKIFQSPSDYCESHKSVGLFKPKRLNIFGQKDRNRQDSKLHKHKTLPLQQKYCEKKENENAIDEKLQKTRTQPFCESEQSKNKGNRKDILKNYYEQELQKKLCIEDLKESKPRQYSKKNTSDIMKPTEFANMIKELRMTSKSRRIKHVRQVLKLASDSPQYSNNEVNKKVSFIHRR